MTDEEPRMTAEKEQQIRALLADLPIRGTWQEGTAGSCNLVDYDGDDIVGVAFVPSDKKRAFIAAAPESIRLLLAELDAVRAERAKLRSMVRSGEYPDGCPECKELFGDA